METSDTSFISTLSGAITLAIGLLGNAVSRVLNDDADPASVLGETAASIKYILKERDD